MKRGRSLSPSLTWGFAFAALAVGAAARALSARAATICIIGDCAGLTFTFAQSVGPTTAIPGGTGNFTGLFTAPSISNGVVAFGGQGLLQLGLYVVVPPAPILPPAPIAPPAPIRVADLSTPIPDSTGTFLALYAPAISGLNIAFVGSGTGGLGVYLASPSPVVPPNPIAPLNPIRVADLNTPLPGGVGNFTSFVPGASVDGGFVLFNAFGAPGQSGIYLFTRGDISTVFSAPGQLPVDAGHTSATIKRTPPSDLRLANGNAAFIASDGAFEGVYLSAGTTGQFANVANTSTTLVPGTASLFQSFGTLSYDGTMVAFGSPAVGSAVAGVQGVYKVIPAPPGAPPNAILKVADTNTLVPGGVGLFSGFEGVVIDLGVVVFEGVSSDGLGGTTFGIYTDMGGALSKIVATGDVVNGTTVASLFFGAGGFSQGQVTYGATYGDGSFALTIATPATLVQPTLASPLPGAFVRGSVGFSADAPGATAVTFQVDGGAPLTTTFAGDVRWTLAPPLDTRALADGPHTLVAESVQLLGAMFIRSFFISDNTIPSVTINPIAPVVHGTIPIAATASDATSGIANITIVVDTTPLVSCANATTCTANLDTTKFRKGRFTVKATATDGAGNVSATATATAQSLDGGASLILHVDGVPRRRH
jgi:hypothetical protein